eukprot:1137815-Pelagomonas_calceolata.AAC.6
MMWCRLAVRKLRGCHGLNSASDRNMGPAGSVGGGSGEFLDKLLGGGKGGAAQLGSLVSAVGGQGAGSLVMVAQHMVGRQAAGGRDRGAQHRLGLWQVAGEGQGSSTYWVS